MCERERERESVSECVCCAKRQHKSGQNTANKCLLSHHPKGDTLAGAVKQKKLCGSFIVSFNRRHNHTIDVMWFLFTKFFGSCANKLKVCLIFIVR